MLIDIYQSVLDYLETGGWVMGPLVVVSIFIVLLISLKLLEMRAFTKGDISAENCVISYGASGFRAAIWQEEILKGFLKERTFDEDLDRNILDSLRLRQESFVKRLTPTIGLLSVAAPLLGLLGTVSGMIQVFTAIAMFGTGNAKALASGISEALITTQTGLVVAIPGLLMASFLNRRSENLTARMERFCLGLLKLHRRIETRITGENI